MLTRLFYTFIFLLPLLFSCNNRQQINALQQETEQIHDAAMKDMADMNRLGRSLKKELSVLDSLPSPTPRRDSIVETLAVMGKAEEGMMAWMTQYKAPENQPANAALAYLKDQKQKIEQNRDDILAALEMAKKMGP